MSEEPFYIPSLAIRVTVRSARNKSMVNERTQRHERVRQPTDQELLHASSSDPEAFGQFYDRYFDSVLRYFCRRTSCSHLAADLTAETFAKALLGCRRFRSESGSASQWLFGIARHELLGMFRKKAVSDRAMQRLGIGMIPVDDMSLERIEALIDASARVVDLREAMQQLPPAVAQAVTLRVGHELSFEEVASRLGCSTGAARVRVSRGLTKLAEVVDA